MSTSAVGGKEKNGDINQVPYSVCVVQVKDRVGGGDWLLRIRCTCGGLVCGGVGVREGVLVFSWSGCSMVLCLVLVLRCARVVVYAMGC